MSDAVTTQAKAVEEGIFASLDPPQLLGSRCADCATVVFPTVAFPKPGSCPCCSSNNVVSSALPTAGTLWSWTVQRVEPKKPYVASDSDFEPFAVGYVDLGEVLVESRLVGPVDAFDIGAPMRLVLLPIPPAPEDESPVVTFAFAREAGQP